MQKWMNLGLVLIAAVWLAGIAQTAVNYITEIQVLRNLKIELADVGVSAEQETVTAHMTFSNQVSGEVCLGAMVLRLYLDREYIGTTGLAREETICLSGGGHRNMSFDLSPAPLFWATVQEAAGREAAWTVEGRTTLFLPYRELRYPVEAVYPQGAH